jgi:hypothetical protein
MKKKLLKKCFDFAHSMPDLNALEVECIDCHKKYVGRFGGTCPACNGALSVPWKKSGRLKK